MHNWRDGQISELGESRSFEVVRLRKGTLEGASPEQDTAFKRELSELGRRVSGAQAKLAETKLRMDGIVAALKESTVSDPAIRAEARRLRRASAALNEKLSGNKRRGLLNDPGPISIERRLSVARLGVRWSTYGPTKLHRESMGIAKEGFAALRTALDQLVGTDLPALEKRLEEAGVPWSAGRK